MSTYEIVILSLMKFMSIFSFYSQNRSDNETPSKYITTFRKMSEKYNSEGQFNEHLKKMVGEGDEE